MWERGKRSEGEEARRNKIKRIDGFSKKTRANTQTINGDKR